MQKKLLFTASLLGFLSVAFGAFGAHGLKPLLSPYQISIFEKAVFYQFIHVLASLVALILSKLYEQKMFVTAALLFQIGILLFSGSLYLLAIKDVLNLNTSILGPITPIGGVFFMAGWCWMYIGVYRSSENSN